MRRTMGTIPGIALRLATLAALICLALPVAPHAAPLPSQEVLLYPDGARVAVTVKLPPRPLDDATSTLTLDLPASADGDSLTVEVPGRDVLGIDIATVAATPSPIRKALMERHDAARADLAKVRGTKAAVEARMALWAGAGQKGTVSPADLERVDALMAKHFTALQGEHDALSLREEEAARHLARAEDELARVGGGDNAPRATVRIAGASDTPVEVRYAYDVTGCGWDAAYRLDARPDRGLVVFMQEAILRQSADLDWKNVRLTLASARPDGRLQPPPVGAWRIGPRPVHASGPTLMRSAAPVAMEAASADMGKMSAPPREEEHASFSTWALGPRDLPPATPIRVTLATEDWPATFAHTIRPARDTAAYLAAHVTLAEARAFPRGMAMHLVDGASVGEAPFEAVGAGLDIFFGSDPRVTARLKPLKAQSGKTGIIERRQTRQWAWDIEIRNGRTRDVAVVVEDPAPQTTDTAVTVVRRSTPEPQEKDSVLRWHITVAPGAVSTIHHEVDATAPEDMRLDPGR